MYFFRLEYNDEQRLFHFEDDLDLPIDFKRGWLPISEKVAYDDCIRFVDYIEKKYKEDYPDFFKIYLEFDLYKRLN
jgi:hypothetical protein